MFKCQQCVKSFMRADSLCRHVKIHSSVRFTCDICPATYNRKDNLKNHMMCKHGINARPAETAPVIAVPTNASNNFVDPDDELCLLALESAENAGFCDGPSTSNNENSGVVVGKIKRARLNLVGDSIGFVRVGTSFNNTITWYYKKNLKNILSHSTFLNSCKSELLNILKSSSIPVKFNLKLEATYNKPHIDNSTTNRAFKTSARAIYIDSDIGETIDRMYEQILSEEDEYQGKGSGFTLEKIDGLLLGVYKYTPMIGSSYLPLLL